MKTTSTACSKVLMSTPVAMQTIPTALNCCPSRSKLGDSSSKTSNSNSETIIPLPADFAPNFYTVLCSRGAGFYQSVGNKRFRLTVSRRAQEYRDARKSKFQKSTIVTEVIETIHAAGGHFIRPVDPTKIKMSPKGKKSKVSDCAALPTVDETFSWFSAKEWCYLDDTAMREKVSATFRDLLHTKYVSASKTKNDARKQRVLDAKKKHQARQAVTTSPSPALCRSDDISESHNSSAGDSSSSSLSESQRREENPIGSTRNGLQRRALPLNAGRTRATSQALASNTAPLLSISGGASPIGSYIAVPQQPQHSAACSCSCNCSGGKALSSSFGPLCPKTPAVVSPRSSLRSCPGRLISDHQQKLDVTPWWGDSSATCSGGFMPVEGEGEWNLGIF